MNPKYFSERNINSKKISSILRVIHFKLCFNIIKYEFLRESFLFIIKALTNILVTFDFRYEFEKDISFQKGCKESRCRSDLQLLATVLGTSSCFCNR